MRSPASTRPSLSPPGYGSRSTRLLGVERVPRRVEVLDRSRVRGPGGRRVEAHAAGAEGLPHLGEVVVGRVGCGAHRERLLDDRVARVEHRRVVARQPHAAGDQRERGVAADRPAEVPQRLGPHLAAVVRSADVVGAGDVAVGVAARAPRWPCRCGCSSRSRRPRPGSRSAWSGCRSARRRGCRW